LTSRLEDRVLPLVLDGGMGRELRSRGVRIPESIWSANGLIEAPDIVRQIHLDYIAAGADIITTNSYGVIREDLAKDGIEDQFEALTRLSGQLAVEARDQSGKDVLIAGSLPPLRGSYRPDLVGPFDEIEPEYAHQAELLTPYVDLFICETMSAGREGYAAAHGALRTGKPVWVAWTLHEDQSGRLRSRETIAEAAAQVADLPISGMLANCSAPESITTAIEQLRDAGYRYWGGYANTFVPVPPLWTLDGPNDTDGLIPVREDLEPEQYADFAQVWLDAGATVVGGCCGTRPDHIARIKSLVAANA
jgi:S-methylmethionine-dependent homocysteine/selenocysteine methylase